MTPNPTSELQGKVPQRQAAMGTDTGSTSQPAGGGHEILVDSISTKLAEMLARALKQSVAEAVDEALSKGWQNDKPLPPAAPNTTAAEKGNPPNVKEPPKPGPAAA